MSIKLDKTKLGEKFDRRIKLTKQDKLDILELKGIKHIQEVANLYNVNRRTISFIWNPEALEENKKRRQERGGTSQYYDKERNTKYIRDNRQYKRELIDKGLLKYPEEV